MQVLGGSRMTVDELRSLAARQQQEIALKEKELRAKDEQLKKLKQEERARRSGNARSKYLQELEAQAEVQNQRLKKLREDQKEADKYSIRNIYLGESDGYNIFSLALCILLSTVIDTAFNKIMLL